MDEQTTEKRKRGGQFKPLEERRRHVLSVFVNAAELAQIRTNAEKAGLPASVFTRKAALQEVIQAKPADEFSESMTHFVHLAGNLNAVSKNLHQARIGGALGAAVTNRIGDIEFLMDAIAQDLQDVRLILVKVVGE